MTSDNDWLRATLPPGAEVVTILRHVSRTGLLRCVSPVIDGNDHSWLVARALGMRVDQKKGGIRISGCGSDTGHNLVYSLSHALYPDGFDCLGMTGPVGAYPLQRERCPSNDHNNGDRCYDASHHHKDGGYALRQRWL